MIHLIDKEHIKEIAKIHEQELKGDFLPSLGSVFLETIYQGLLNRSQLLGFVYIKKGQVVGFIIGTADMTKFFGSAVKANFLKLSGLIILKILQRPAIVRRIAETFLYPKKDTGAKAELVVIGVLKKWHGKGIGRKLIMALENKFKKIGIKTYKLTVYQDKKAILFYQKLNFIKKGNFILYGKPWSIYEKKIR